MGNPTMAREFDDRARRRRVCQRLWDDKHKTKRSQDMAEMNDDREDTIRRCFRTEQLRVLDEEGKRPRIAGLLAPYAAPSEDLGGFREQFARGAFSESIRSGADVFADIEHDPGKKLARTANQTLKLSETREGVRAEITLPDTTLGRDTLEEVRSGILDAMSVGFRDPEASWRGTDEDTLRTIKKARLTGVALTSFPAFPQTAGTVTERSLAAYRAEEDKERKKGEEGETEKLRKRLDLEEAF